MSDESAVVYVCVMDGVHWHLYPPVNLWANAVLVDVAKNAAEIHEGTAYGHECLGRQGFVMTSASIDGEAGGGAVAVDDEGESA